MSHPDQNLSNTVVCALTDFQANRLPEALKQKAKNLELFKITVR